MSIEVDVKAVKFLLLLTEEQKEVCNSFLHSPDDYCWITYTEMEFDNIVAFAVYINHCLTSLESEGWATWKTKDFRAPTLLTLDLRFLEKESC